MEDFFYVLLSILMLILVVFVPYWFLARASHFHKSQPGNDEESSGTSADATARTAVAVSGMNTLTQE